MRQDYDVFIGSITEDIHWQDELYESSGKGIHWFSIDSLSGHLTLQRMIWAGKNPTYMVRDRSGDYLYVANELQEFEHEATGCVSSFRINQEEKMLELVNQKATEGTDPNYLSLDKAESHLYVTNFTSGSVAVFPIGRGGELGKMQQFIRHQGSGKNPIRQSSAHPHSLIMSPDGRFAVVPDLGTDQIVVYRLDDADGGLGQGALQREQTDSGSGPRHGVFHPNGCFFYVTLELNSEVAAYEFDQKTGLLVWKQTISSSVADQAEMNTSADIAVRPDGKYLYVSNRGHGNIVVYSIDQEEGTLKFAGKAASGGEKPRSIAMTPDGRFLLAANQDNGIVTVFHVDEECGTLEQTEQVQVPSAAGIKIYQGGANA